LKPVVMVIDDDYGITNLLSLMLSRYDYIPITASNGSFALNTLKHCSLPSLILTDYSMPMLNGCEFIEHVALQNHLKHIPILMMTGSNIEDVRLPTSTNYKGVIMKPFDVSAILEKITPYLHVNTYPSSYDSLCDSSVYLA